MKITKIFTFFVLSLSIFFFTENTFSAWNTNNWVYCPENDPFCLGKVSPNIKVETELDDIVTNWTVYLLWFLYLVSVIYWLYWAYNILTAASDDEKVEKWKKIIMRAVLWIIVIFSSSIIAQAIFWNPKSKDYTENKNSILQQMNWEKNKP